MHYRDDNELIVAKIIDYAVGKSFDLAVSSCFGELRPSFGKLDHPFGCLFDFV